jgi:hypothetical protein
MHGFEIMIEGMKVEDGVDSGTHKQREKGKC